MVQRKSLFAGVLGVICALGVFGSIVFSQATLFGPTLTPSAVVPFSGSSTVNNQSVVPANNLGVEYGPVGLGPNSPQTISNLGSPSLQISIAILGILALAVSVGAAFVISRRM